jgi:hypothetical protein
MSGLRPSGPLRRGSGTLPWDTVIARAAAAITDLNLFAESVAPMASMLQ